MLHKRNFEDHELKTLLDFIPKIEEEQKRQILKHGLQTKPLPEWMLWLAEENGEFAQAINDYIYHHGPAYPIIEEGIQSVTLTLKILESVMIHEAKQRSVDARYS